MLIGSKESFDVGERGLYVNSDPHEYKNELLREEIEFINNKTSQMDQHVKLLIKQ